jgi:predicted dithiol-disulfide oxidoreductase (DUF899 family)
MADYLLPSQSAESVKRREALRDAEIELMLQRERVAALRRALPRDEIVTDDWRFLEGPADLSAGDTPVREVALGGLFRDPGKPLVLMHFMFGGSQKNPCPMCTLWADGYDGVIPHLEQRVNFAVVVAGDLATMREYARQRGWKNVRIVSCVGSGLKRALGFEDESGGQMPGTSVFELTRNGEVSHFYSGGARLSSEHFRGMDLLSPLWHFLDLTPDGRGDFMPRKQYA